MDIRGELRYRSLYWYNDGLKKAKIRDLTGALASLKKSIRLTSIIRMREIFLALFTMEEARCLARWPSGSSASD